MNSTIANGSRSGKAASSFRALLLIAVALVCQGSAGAAEHPVLTLHHFERLYIEDQPTPPHTVQEGWQPVVLKDVWSHRQRPVRREAWYRTTFDWGDRAVAGPALLVQRVSANTSFWLNGYEIGNTGPFADPLPRNWNHPVFFTFPQQLMRRAGNELYVRLKTDDSRFGMLYEINLGPRAVLHPQYRTSYFAKVTASQILSALMLIAGIILLVFHRTTRLPASYVWFALGSLCWSLYSLELFIRNIPVPTRAWVLFYSSMAILAAFFYTRAVHETLGLRNRLPGRLILAAGALNVVGVLLPSPRLPVGELRLGLMVFFAWLVYLGFTLCRGALRRDADHRGWLFACGATVLLLTGYDLVTGIFQITTLFAKVPYLPLVGLLAGASIFIQRLIETDRQSKHLQVALAATRDEQRRAVSSERERLMREIHDGVGSQLVSTLAHLENSSDADREIVEHLRVSLEDLRLVVHSLDAMAQQGDVVTILATIRERVEEALNAQGIRFDWQVRPLPAIPSLGCEGSLQLMRLVQEALTNIIRHAGARRIRLACGEENQLGVPGVFVEIEDDGHGFPARRCGAGLGIANMHHRALQLHGNLTITSNGGGTRVRLWIPLDQSTPPAQPVGAGHGAADAARVVDTG